MPLPQSRTPRSTTPIATVRVKLNGRVWIVVVVVEPIAEVDNLVADCAEQDVDLLFHFVSAMIAAMPTFIFSPSIPGSSTVEFV
jgi:hypothetical protein